MLMASAIGSYAHAVTLESALAVALTLRGAEVHVLLCDAALPACAECDVSFYPNLDAFTAHGPSRDLCRDCRWPAERLYQRLGVTIHRLSTYLTADDRRNATALAQAVPVASIATYRFEGLAVGEHAQAGALRFFATGTLDGGSASEAVLRRYFESSLLTVFATRRLLRAQDIASVVCTHGIYVPWGLIGEVARQANVSLSTWNVAYRKRRFIFSHHDTYHHTLMDEPHETWEQLELSPLRERDLMQYLESRREGTDDWIVFHRTAQQDPQAVAQNLGLDASRPIIGLLTNVAWDAQLHYPANAFPNMLEWLIETCRYFETRTDLQLVIRVHPGELSGFPPSRQPILDELASRIPRLAANIHVVPPESGISTYALMSLCNAAIIYGTKMGVELTSAGQPVIVAGEAWIRNKGLTLDTSSSEDYFKLLDRLPLATPLAPDQVARARRYAYHFFFRRMIPVSFVEPQAGYPVYRLNLDSIEALGRGKSPGLDTICDGILQGTPFVLRDDAMSSDRRS